MMVRAGLAFAPLLWLHGMQLACRLDGSSLPPSDRGTMWSALVAVPPHQAQRYPSRRST